MQFETRFRCGLERLLLLAAVSFALSGESYGSQALDELIRSIEPAPVVEMTRSSEKVPVCLQPPQADIVQNPKRPAVSAASAVVCDPNHAPDIEAHWIGGMPWMGGNPISGGVTLFNSIGREMIGTVESNLTPGQYVPVEIRLDPAETTFCQTFRLETNFGPAGVGVFPGSAWDITDPGNPRRLNIGFTEYNDNAGPIPPPNFFWDPDTTRTSPRFGKFEFVFIMLSDYDGTGLTYAGVNPYTTDQDMLYFWYPRLEPGHAWFETLPASIQIEVFRDYITDQGASAFDTTISVFWTHCGNTIPDHYRIYRDVVNPPNAFLTDVPGNLSYYDDTPVEYEITYYYRIEIFGPGDSLMGHGPVSAARTQKPFENMTFISHWGEGMSYGGIWGYTDPASGHEWALLCTRNVGRVEVIDIDGASGPTLIGRLQAFNDTKEVKTYQHYAVIVSENGPLNIYDLEDLSATQNPLPIGVVHPEGGGSHNCLVDGHYLYVIGNHGRGGLEIFDIINPTTPVKVGEFQPFYYHDVTIRHDTLYAYGIYGQGIDIIDVSNKHAPSLISRFNYPGSGSHNGELSYDGKYLFIGDEIGQGPWTRVFDVSDPHNVTLIDDIIVDPFSVAHNCYRRGDILYIGHYGRGIRAWNVSDPLNSHEVGFLDTQIGFDGAFGCWTAYPMPSGRIIASDMAAGLVVMTFDGVETAYCECDCHGDPDCNNVTDVVDVVNVITSAFSGTPSAPDPGQGCATETTDLDCSGATNIVDVVKSINVTFRGAEPRWEICKPCYP